MGEPARIVTTTYVEGAPRADFGALETAATAYGRAGLWERLRAAGLALDGPHAVTVPEGILTADDRIGNLGRIGAATSAEIADGLRAGQRTLLAGGACHAVVGAVAGVQAAHGPAARLGLVWFDAHGDFNTPGTTITGRLGGMPVAVAAGLAYPRWRALAGQAAPLPTDRIVMVDVRNLDPKERDLIAATDVEIVPIDDRLAALDAAVRRLAAECDLLYLHVDVDVLDARYVPNHPTVELNGPSLEATLRAIGRVLATGKVGLAAVVSVNVVGEGGDRSLASGVALIEGLLTRWPAAE
jgi:arginase